MAVSAGAYAQIGKPGAALHLEKTSIVSGEPVVITVVLSNPSGEAVLLPVGDSAEVTEWSTVRPGGAIDPRRESADARMTLVFSCVVSPSAQAAFRAVAKETAGLKRPGQYRITLNYNPLEVIQSLEFFVLPGSASALRKVAEELRDRTVSNADPQDRSIALDVLGSMNYQAAEPFLCDAMHEDSANVADLAARVGETGGARGADCLIEEPQNTTGAARDAVTTALRNIAKRAGDAQLPQRIREELKE